MVFDEFKPVENHQWNANNNVNFIVSNSDTISTNNVFINIRNNKNYEFSSLFLIAKMEFPSGYRVIDTLEYEMTDAYGNWLGQGFTDIKENILFYKENVVFVVIGLMTNPRVVSGSMRSPEPRSIDVNRNVAMS